MAEADPAPLPLEQRRPLSPHIQIYKLSPTMVVSGGHRVSGLVLYIGTLLLAWYLLAAASDKGSFLTASGFFGSIIGQLLLFGYTFALMLHAVGGVRHAIWDAGDLRSRDARCSGLGIAHLRRRSHDPDLDRVFILR